MKFNIRNLALAAFSIFTIIACDSSKKAAQNKDFLNEPQSARDQRMEWWRDARFGMFIHWGLYAVPAGEWNGETKYGEWIRHTAKIPLETYDGFVNQFNPTQFNADEWVQMAKDAGMKYIVITSKHHDGFAIYDSKVSDFDVMATPFKRDILKELAEACKREGIRLCFYHSIMDWHHPDYLPRRDWELANRPEKGAKYDRYVKYMKAQLKELLTNYGEAPHVLWFDGEWESTWNDTRGTDLYNYVRSLKPNILINNRVGASRNGMAGFTAPGQFAGDFGTPEQEIPTTGLPGVDWESCMTMNDNWGYNKADKNFKSTTKMIRDLADIASKGGNFLMNVGPTAEGTFPKESIQRLKEIGEWMKKNGESIYGTSASPIGSFDWGRVTMKQAGENTILYLHLFDLPKDRKLVLNGIGNTPQGAAFLAYPTTRSPKIERTEDAIEIEVSQGLPDKHNTVIMLQLKGKPDFHLAPIIKAKRDIFTTEMAIELVDTYGNVDIHYTLDGTTPTSSSNKYSVPLKLNETATVTARAFRNGNPISGTSQRTFWKKELQGGWTSAAMAPGLMYFYYEGNWTSMPSFDRIGAHKKGVVMNFDRSAKKADGEHYGFEFRGFIKIPTDGIYTFSTASDDGSQLFINNQLLVDNDGLHGLTKKSGDVALMAGYHELIVRYFEGTGSDELKVTWASDDFKEAPIPDEVLFHVPKK